MRYDDIADPDQGSGFMGLDLAPGDAARAKAVLAARALTGSEEAISELPLLTQVLVLIAEPEPPESYVDIPDEVAECAEKHFVRRPARLDPEADDAEMPLTWPPTPKLVALWERARRANAVRKVCAAGWADALDPLEVARALERGVECERPTKPRVCDARSRSR